MLRRYDNFTCKDVHAKMILNRRFFFLYLHEKRSRQAGARKALGEDREVLKNEAFSYLGILHVDYYALRNPASYQRSTKLDCIIPCAR
jgi:hypothetical protein